jgi:glyoxylase-like metal-dependent hydrolase (beta-lactamase superfamily II)
VRAVALHEDVIVFVSDVWQTTCTAVRGEDEGFVIDSPVYPEELRALPDVLEQAGFPVSGLLATHGDWDHLLSRLAYPGGALGAAESTVARISAEMGEAQRRLRGFDEEHYVPDRGPLALGSLQALPVPGRLEVGTRIPAGAAGGGEDGPARELEMSPADGHTGDGAAYWLAWAGVLICGDYLSPVEIPMISAASGGSLEAYRATLARLSGLIARAEWVVPGHGAPLSRRRAEEVLREDDRYLAELQRDSGTARAPASRGATPSQRRIHEANVAAVSVRS